MTLPRGKSNSEAAQGPDVVGNARAAGMGKAEAAAWAHDQISDMWIVRDYPTTFDLGYNAAIKDVLDVFEKAEAEADAAR